jgi:hypothetical protein
MSTQINIAIGDQRLLQESKTRAAANQQSLDSRLEEQQLAEQLTEAKEEATPEDPRSDAFSLRLDRRPAAQRRKKEEEEDEEGGEGGASSLYGLYYTSDTVPKILPNSGTFPKNGSWTYTNVLAGELISAECTRDDDGRPFTASYAPRVPTQFLTLASHNDYFDRVERFQPILNFGGPIILSKFDQPETWVPNPVVSGSSIPKRWLLTIYLGYSENIYTCETYATRLERGSVYVTNFYLLRSDNPTPFPHEFVYSPMRIVLARSESSSEDAIFTTYVIKQGPHKVGRRRYSSSYSGRDNGVATSFSSSDDWAILLPPLGNIPIFGHYTRYDKTTRKTETKIVELQTKNFLDPNGFDTGTPNRFAQELSPRFFPDDSLTYETRLALVNNMYPDDPRKNVYATTSSLDLALDQNLINFTYDRTKGHALFIRLHRSTNFTLWYIYRATYAPGLNYNLVYGFLREARTYFDNLSEPPESFTTSTTYKLIDTFPYDSKVSRLGITPFPPI